MSTEIPNAAGVRESAARSPQERSTARAPLLWLICGFFLLFVALIYAFYTVFTQALGLDEGYLMITVQSFLGRQPLYDVVFTQYGPVYYAYEWILHSVLSIPLTHDATRWLCIFHWLAAAVLVGIGARIVTGSLLGGLFAFMQAVVHLTHLAREPGHPQELIAILLAIGFLAATRVRETEGGLAALGAIAAMLFFIKPNVGIFFGAALFLTLYFHSDRSTPGASGRTWLLIAGCALLPFLLMRRHVMHEWARNYSLLAATTIIVTALAARDSAAQQLSWRRWTGAAIAFGSIALAFAGIALLTGTSLAGLFDGLLATPLKTPNIAMLPFKAPNVALIGAASSLLVAVLASATIKHPRRAPLIALFKLCFAVVTSFLLVGKPQAQLMYVLPWVWLVALPASTSGGQPLLAASYPRVFLAIAAAWQSLQGYPVAGTQLSVGSLLLVLAGIVSLADALASLDVPARVRAFAAGWSSGVITLCRATAAIALICFFAFAWCKLPAVRKHYASLTRLDLPGAKLVRTDGAMTERYQALTAYLRDNCDTFITCPGVSDFYFWTGKRPPTHLNPTSISLLTAPQQEQILSALRRADRPLIAILESIIDNPRVGGTLVQAVRNDYVQVHNLPPFKIYTLKEKQPAASPASSNTAP